MAENKIIYIDEKKQMHICLINDGQFISDDGDVNKLTTCLLSDSLVDLKLIKVPTVSARLLKNIIYNTLKKHSTVLPTEDNIDFQIINKEENQYEVLAFIKRYEDEEFYEKKKLFTIYHIIQNLIKDPSIPDNAMFMTNVENTWFLYSFKNKIFKKRSIYFEEDVKSLKKENIYFLKLFSDSEHKYSEDFKPLPENLQHKAILSLKKNIFKIQPKLDQKKLLSVFGIIAALALAAFLQFQSLELSSEKNQVLAEKEKYEKHYKEAKSNRGITEELYNEYMTIISKQSHVNDFFTHLFNTGRNNVQINRLTYDDNDFTISGICKNDSLLENKFREYSHIIWDNVSFSFKRVNNSYQFVIKGEFINE